MSHSTDAHRAAAPSFVSCAVITVSDSRTFKNDRGGALVVELLESGGHRVARREIVGDEPAQIRPLVLAFADDASIDAVLLTGGTGISGRDQTYETLDNMLNKTMPGFGELFRMLSFEQIGPAAMLSRAIGGVIGETVVLSIPGSTAAVRLAMERLILPELGHLVLETRK